MSAFHAIQRRAPQRKPRAQNYPTAFFHAAIIGLTTFLSMLDSARAETFTLQEATIDQMQKAMTDGALTSVELNALYLNRIAVYDRNGIKLNSVVEINPAVFTEAAAADDLRASGTVLGPLHGIPVLPKMNHAIKGLPLNLDIPQFKDVVATEDAENIVRIRAAGGVIQGEAKFDAYYFDALYDPEGPTIYGPANNAYGLNLWPSDSSTGSGCALASNFTVISLGGDTGTSNRSNCGAEALATGRITYDLMSSRGVAPLIPTRDQAAPMARTIKDLAYAFDALIGDDPLDATRVWRFPDHRFPTQKYAPHVTTGALQGARLGYTQEIIDSLSPVQKPLFLQAIADLQKLGAHVAIIPKYDQLDGDFGGFPANYVADFSQEYGAGYKTVQTLQAAWRWDYNEFAGKFSGNGIDPQFLFDNVWGEMGAATAAFNALAPGVGAVSDTFVQIRAQVRARVENWMAQNDVEAVIYPVEGWGAEFRDDPEAFGDYDLNQKYSTTLPGLGLPGIDAFAGFSDLGAPKCSVEFFGPAFSEAKLFGFAYAYEQATKLRRAPALTPPLPGETIEYSTAQPPPSRPELNPPALRVAGGAKVTGQGKKATLVLKGGAVDASGLRALTVYVNGRKIAARPTKQWKATVKLSTLRKFVKGSAKNVQVTVVAKDIYGNTSVTTKTVKLPKTV